MKVMQTGFILYVINYEACLHFYEKVLGLPVLYRKEALVCFDFFGSYLMVEIDDETALSEVAAPARDRSCLRLNVTDVKAACEVLDAEGIAYTYGEYVWGTIAKFRDPDGNLIGFRSAREHETDQE